ncbi:MAG: Fis family transcriptional regulator, partial [Deltaproteobacteria bacterium RIFOXYD12_FULL_50_9]
MKAILVVSPDQQAAETIRACFHKNYNIHKAATREAALDSFKKKRYDFLFIDLKALMDGLADNNHHAALQPFWLSVPTIEIIVISSQEMIRDAVMAVKAGASNYLTYPINSDEVKYVTESIKESNLVQSELDYLRDQFWQTDSLKVVQTDSPLMQKVFAKIRSVAPTISTVLLMGETGTGKGVMATLIHKHSNRKDAQFINVHCGAIPDTLIESELFGHEKGAFTGASRRKLGKFEIAKEGTIFLDEISTITPAAQIKLLQILQEKTFCRVGGEEMIDANVRIIAATNLDLAKMCDEGLFRKDLYYRLNVFPLEIPSLRERREDIPLLVEVFLEKLNRFHSKDIHGVHPEVME